MAVTITRRLLSGSVDGQGIGITATQGATYNTIHTSTSAGSGTIDEVYLYVNNNYTATVKVAIEWGNSATQSTMIIAVDPQIGPQQVVPGLLILGSATAAVDIAAYHAGTASTVTSGAIQISFYGHVNRIVQT